MLMVMKRSISLLIFIVFAISTSFVHAQIPNTSGGAASSLTLSPQHPEPFEEVRITLNDYTLNTNGATFAWFIDGTEIQSAANERAITITAGELGSITEITEITTLPGGAKIPTKVIIKPIRVDMLIEADTIAPLFYKGRTVPAVGSTVSVTAIPFTGTPQNPESFSYTWKVRNEVIGGGSRFGKNHIAFNSDFGKNIPVSVEIYDNTGALVTKESIIVPLSEPELHFYEINPLRGLSERVMGNNFTFIGDEIRVRAEPYFLDSALLSQNPHIEWKLNNRTTQNQSGDPQEITLRKEGTTGSFTLEFHIRNLRQLLQGVKDTVTISF